MTYKNIVMFGLLSVFAGSMFASFEQYNALIQCVRKHENRIFYLRQQVDRLWHVCFEYASVVDGAVHTRINNHVTVSENRYRRDIRRKVTCTERDVIEYNQVNAYLQTAIQDALVEIRTCIISGVDVISVDYEGKTAINHCYTKEIYEELRRHGVPFQWQVWCYFYPELAGLAAFGTLAVSVGVMRIAIHR